MTIDITIDADQEAFLVDAPTPTTHHTGGSRLSHPARYLISGDRRDIHDINVEGCRVRATQS